MSDYQTLGHMEAVPTDQLDKPCSEVYYIPHHAVMKASSSTTKLRVVFDASAKSSSGVALNDKLMVGPKLQEDIAPLLIRFRKHAIPLVADIAKMYRQIQVNNLQTDFQRIVWRTSPEEPIQVFKLLTVTYGESCAPYLATKCLQQLAKDEERSFPMAAAVVLKDFYVDDLMSGADTIEDALKLQDKLIQLMNQGGFQLRKWSSSAPALLSAVPEEMREPDIPLIIDGDKAVKTLGLQWHPATDQFSFSVTQPSQRSVVTKRLVLSDLAKVFDPLGWLSPVTIKAKLVFQSLWSLDLTWDDALPEDIHTIWRNYCEELPSLQEICIDRCIRAP
jgi:Pao retrotransposon peptidase